MKVRAKYNEVGIQVAYASVLSEILLELAGNNEIQNKMATDTNDEDITDTTRRTPCSPSLPSPSSAPTRVTDVYSEMLMGLY